MKAKYVFENIEFQRGTDPIDSMKVGRVSRRDNKRAIEKISEIISTDLSKETDQILNILDKYGISIEGVDPEYDGEYGERSHLWIYWGPNNGGEGFSFVQFPKEMPKEKRGIFSRKPKYEDSETNDPWASEHNADVVKRILSEMIWQVHSGWPEEKVDYSKEDFQNLKKELSFLKGK